MSGVPSILVADLPALLEQMNSSEFWVKWQVRPEGGPEWVGGGCLITFSLGERPLAETPFHDRLRSLLIQSAGIPQTTEDAVIYGEGEIRLVGNELVVEYDWHSARPYWRTENSGSGTAVLLVFADPTAAEDGS